MKPKKTITYYYSKTGTTKRVAKLIAKKLGSDIEELIDTKNRKGIIGYFVSCFDSKKKKLTQLEKLRKKPSDYDLVIVGGPVWAWSINPAVRTFLAENKIKKAALFCTMGGSGSEKFFEECRSLIKGKVVAEASVIALNAKNPELDSFIKKLK
jgi:flavodoxin